MDNKNEKQKECENTDKNTQATPINEHPLKEEIFEKIKKGEIVFS